MDQEGLLAQARTWIWDSGLIWQVGEMSQMQSGGGGQGNAMVQTLEEELGSLAVKDFLVEFLLHQTAHLALAQSWAKESTLLCNKSFILEVQSIVSLVKCK